ncbi:MAG: hypothetical protein J0L85_06775 [Zoogloea sp.]|nr:hypothetical protein [Zoogloea sp.]MCA0184998.1 hypothetical protein [Pseudomonadota bacterium]
MVALHHLAATALMALTPLPAMAAYIVDTGPGIRGEPWSFEPAQYFAGEFSLNAWQSIHAIEGYYSNIENTSGTVTIRLHRDGGNTPGEILFSHAHALPAASSLDWYGLSGLDWLVGPGTYWVSFEPDSGIKGIYPGKAPNPMDEYAQHSGGGWLDWGPDRFDYLDLGVRIDATAIPEPAPLTLALTGLVGMAAARRRSRHP